MEPIREPEPQKEPEDVEVEQPVQTDQKVNAYGKGKTGFVEAIQEVEVEAKVLECPDDVKMEEVTKFPEPEKTYTEGKSSIRKSMKDFLADEEQKKEGVKKSPNKDQASVEMRQKVSAPAHVLDDLIGSVPVNAPAKEVNPVSHAPSHPPYRAGYNLNQRKVIGPAYEEEDDKIQIKYQPAFVE